MEHHSSRLTLAIDPGTRNTGVALFEGIELVEAFTLKAPIKEKDSEVRAFNLIQTLEERVKSFLICTTCGTAHARS